VFNGTYQEFTIPIYNRIVNIRGQDDVNKRIPITIVEFPSGTQSQLLNITTGALKVENLWFKLESSTSGAMRSAVALV
jgi:hypothetical protein